MTSEEETTSNNNTNYARFCQTFNNLLNSLIKRTKELFDYKNETISKALDNALSLTLILSSYSQSNDKLRINNEEFRIIIEEQKNNLIKKIINEEDFNQELTTITELLYQKINTY